MTKAPKKNGRPTKRTEAVVQCILDGLTAGTPLTVLCSPVDMPATSTVYDWLSADEALSGQFARAREAGFDAIAVEAQKIIDEYPERTATEHGDKVDPGYVQYQKNRAELRLKLLAKWDPKRYGERLALAGDESAPLRISVTGDDAAL